MGEVFNGATRLEYVIMDPDVPPSIVNTTFRYNPNTYKIYVPEEYLADYKTSWSVFASHIEVIPDNLLLS